MISVVVGDQERFAQDRLAVAMRNLGEEISRGLRNEIFHLFQIAAELGNCFLPKFRIAGFVGPWQISFGQFRRSVIFVAAEFENVPLRDPHVLEHLPRSVGQVLNPLAATLRRETSEKVFKVDVRVAATQQLQQMFAKCLRVVIYHFVAILSENTASTWGWDRGGLVRKASPSLNRFQCSRFAL